MQCMIMLEITNQVPKGIDSKMLQWYSELQCYILGRKRWPNDAPDGH